MTIFPEWVYLWLNVSNYNISDFVYQVSHGRLLLAAFSQNGFKMLCYKVQSQFRCYLMNADVMLYQSEHWTANTVVSTHSSSHFCNTYLHSSIFKANTHVKQRSVVLFHLAFSYLVMVSFPLRLPKEQCVSVSHVTKQYVGPHCLTVRRISNSPWGTRVTGITNNSLCWEHVCFKPCCIDMCYLLKRLNISSVTI